MRSCRRIRNDKMEYSSIFLAILVCGLAHAETNTTVPEQIHIATNSPNSMGIVWNTKTDTPASVVFFGTNSQTLDKLVKGSSTKFTYAGSKNISQYVHSANLTDLQAGRVYYYKVGCPKYGYSSVRAFKTWPEGEKWSPRLAIYGDMGASNDRSLPDLQKDVNKGLYDAIVHVGDFAYDLFSDDGKTGDKFMREIDPLASTLPYMTCPGNHESHNNFSHYKHRFNMPGDIDDRMYFSFKMGPIRFISTNTESVFNPALGVVVIKNNYAWLKNELEDANKPENRAKQPWVITYGHRPMYCSNSDGDDCTKNESLVRTGIPSLKIPGWEKIFYDNGVDIAIWAHEHSYERSFPIYNRKMMNGSTEHPYTNPKAPVHIITGSAGDSEGQNPFKKTHAAWSAFRSLDYGYTRMQVFNATHVYMEQVSHDQGGKVIDSVWVIKDKHGSYTPDPTPIKPAVDEEILIKQFMNRWANGEKNLL